MKKFRIILLIACFTVFNISMVKAHKEKEPVKDKKENNNNEANYSISGKIIDFETGETLAGVQVAILELGISFYSDLDGCFKIINIDKGTYTFATQYISYENYCERQEIGINEKSEFLIKLNR